MQGNKDVLKKHCGLPISTYFSALKLRWLIDNVTEVREAIEEDRCLFGTVDTWLIWVINLSLNELIFIELSVINLTESDRRGQWWAPSNGCDQRFTNDAYEPWNVELGSVPLQVISPNLQLLPSLYLHFFLIREKLSRIGINYSYKLKIFFFVFEHRFFDIPTSILPEIRSSSEIYGYLTSEHLTGIPISGVWYHRSLNDNEACFHSFFSPLAVSGRSAGCFDWSTLSQTW